MKILNASMIGISYKIMNYAIEKAKNKTLDYLYNETSNILIEKTKVLFVSFFYKKTNNEYTV
jgi:hypothetical protein